RRVRLRDGRALFARDHRRARPGRPPRAHAPAPARLAGLTRAHRANEPRAGPAMNRTLLLASVALLVAGFLSFWMYQQQYRVEHGGGPTIEVVSALIDIPLGQPVRAEWLTTEEIPQSYLEERHIPATSMRDLVGLPLAQSVLAGET